MIWACDNGQDFGSAVVLELAELLLELLEFPHQVSHGRRPDGIGQRIPGDKSRLPRPVQELDRRLRPRSDRC